MKIMTSFMGVLVLLIFLPFPAQAGPIGRITHVEGRVDITTPGQIARPVHLGFSVQVGDIIRTKSRSKAEITFMDATVMRLAQKSRVEISDYMIGKRKRRGVIRLFRGKIRSVVSKFLRMTSFSSRNRYEVHTPTAVAGVRGTDFVVFYQRGVSGAIFKEGLGYGYSLNKPLDIREIVAGQAMLVLNADQPPAVRSLSGVEIQKHLNDTEPLEKHEIKAEEKDESIVIAEGAPAETDMGTQGDLASEQETGAAESLRSEGLPSLMNSPEVVANLEPDTTYVIPITEIETEIVETIASDITTPDIPSPDATPPAISITGTPASISNSNSANFEVSSDEEVTYTYTLDGEEVDAICFTDLDEGGHAFQVTATDEAGNSSTETCTWTTDYTSPVIATGDPPKLDMDSHAVSFSLSCDERVTYSYHVDSGEWVNADSLPITIAGLSDGEHTFEVQATDEAGNISCSITSDLSLYELTDSGTEPVTVTESDCISAHIDQGLGIWGSVLDGTYDGSPSDDWALHLSDEQGSQHQWVEVAGTSWSGGVLAGTAPGAWVNWDTATTGVCGGELNGTFDPTTWQAEVMGGWVETEKFVELAATEAGRVTLAELNIPCIEIGKVKLDGGNNILNVHMEDVTFFAYSTGADPRIWATDGVSGGYSSMPTNGDSVPLSGSGIKVDFTVNAWGSGVWGANVNGGGNFNGSTIQMNGAAAGTYTGASSGEFTGTGAGVVQ